MLINTILMVTAEEIKRLRAILAFTQKDLAEKIGVSISTIANYEAGGVIPSNKQKLLSAMLKEAHTSISNYSGSVNTGNVGGHMVNLADPNVKKIIRGNDIDIERVTPADKDRQVIDVLKARISDLEKLVDAKDALIEILNNNLKNKEL